MKPGDTGVRILSRFSAEEIRNCQISSPFISPVPSFTLSLLLPVFCLLNLLLPLTPACIPLHPSAAFSSPVPKTPSSHLLPPFRSPSAAELSCSSLSALTGFPPRRAGKQDNAVLTFSVLLPGFAWPFPGHRRFLLSTHPRPWSFHLPVFYRKTLCWSRLSPYSSNNHV